MSEIGPEFTKETTWQQLATAADTGNLYLDAEVASHCHSACTRYLEKLDWYVGQAEILARVDCFGTFTAGTQLAAVYSKRAVGGENSLVEVLQSHVQVVTEMQAVFRKFFVDYQDTEHSNSTAIGQARPN